MMHNRHHPYLESLFSDRWSPVQKPVFPENGGVLTCGGSSFGEILAWITEGKPNDWSLIFFDNDMGAYDVLQIPITSFILQIVEGKLHPKCFADSIRDKNKEPIALTWPE